MLLLASEDDLHDVTSAVKNLAGRWKDLGISLGLHPGDLDTILSANLHSPNDCLREMHLQWLRQSYNVEKFGKPTWRRLVEAVKSNAGGNNPALAQTIAEDHPGEPDTKVIELESQQHFRLHPDKGQNSTDSFSPPQGDQVEAVEDDAGGNNHVLAPKIEENHPGEPGPTLKVRRPVVYKKYEATFDAMYSETEHQSNVQMWKSNFSMPRGEVVKPSALNTAKKLGVQFIDPVETVSCDTHGCDYYNSRHDVEVRIPKGAILPSEGTIDIKIGVAMHGPFKLEHGRSVRRVSPIVWLCVEEDGFSKFQKDVEISIPHFLQYSNEDACRDLRFLKADHQLKDDEHEYQLEPADGIAVFDRATHGKLLTKHFCSLCIATSVCLNELSIRYYLGGGIRLKEQDWQIIFYVCYFLPSCLRTVEHQLIKSSKVIYPTNFIFADGKALEINFLRNVSGLLLAIQSPNKISAKDVDFQSLDSLQLREDMELYPPRFVITFNGSSTAEDCHTEFRFQGATEEIVKEIILTTGEDDLRDVRSAVADLAARWKDLGISLGLGWSDLNAILLANPHSPSDCLREMLALWLGQRYKVERFEKPTWRRLVEAVKDKTGGNNPALAQTIMKDYPSLQ